MSDKQPTFIEINNGRIYCGFHAYHKKTESGMYSWYIPGFNIRFSSKDKETGDKRAIIMVNAFFSYWVDRVSYREFILEIHKLGFKAPQHDLTVNRLLTKKVHTAKFKSSVIKLPDPKEYEQSKSLKTELAFSE